jgi:hypothetical protein
LILQIVRNKPKRNSIKNYHKELSQHLFFLYNHNNY